MKHAYLIMAHNQWELLQELLSVLDDPRNDIYLHIDQKASPPRERIERCVSKANLMFTKQYNIVWGGTQIMECTLNMLQEASQKDYSHFHLLSGVDFPLKSQDEIHSFFERFLDKQFVGFDWAGIESRSHENRVKYYHFLINIIGKRDKQSTMYQALARLEDLSIVIQRKLCVNRLDYAMYKGSTWFSITQDVVKAILANRDEILRRYRYSANSDEIWLQTFIKNSSFDEKIMDSNLRYIKWIQGNPSPETLTMEDYDDLISSDKLFARKFDWNKDRDVILKLKEYISKDKPV